LGIKNLFFYFKNKLLIISNDIINISKIKRTLNIEDKINKKSLVNSIKYSTTLTFENLLDNINVCDF
jgi:hypothetical protein